MPLRLLFALDLRRATRRRREWSDGRKTPNWTSASPAAMRCVAFSTSEAVTW